LEPEYAKAAKTLKDEGSEIRLGKVDATVESDLASKFGVRGYPTIKFFRGSDPVDYTGGRQADDIVAWLKKKTGPPAEALTTGDSAKTFIDGADVVVVGYFSDAESDSAKAFLGAAAKLESIPAGIVSDEGVAKETEAEMGTIVVYKKFDDGKVVFSGDFTTEKILEFINGEQLPLFVEFNDVNANKIFGGDIKLHFLVFFSASNDEIAPGINEAAITAAKDFKGKVIFVSIDTDVEDNSRISEYFGLTDADYPTARLIALGDDMMKYKPEFTELTADNMKSFLTDFFDGKVRPHLSSEEIPEDWDKNPVKVLVGKNFWEVVKNGKKDVFVEFYAPWCGHCKALAPIWDQLAEKFADAEDVMIAKMDSTGNEVEGIKVEGFPTLKYFKKENPETPLDYAGGRTLEDLVKYVESRGTDDGVKTADDVDDEFFQSLEDEDLEEAEDLSTEDLPPEETEGSDATKDEL
jgi:protein disulfide-isomerase A1